MALPDQDLIKKAQAGDKSAFTELFERYKDRILNYLRRYTNDYHIAEDLTVETFLNAYNNLANYEEKGVFSSWLYMIATNCARMELRKRSRRKEVSLDENISQDTDNLSLGDVMADESARPDFEARKDELQELSYKIMSKFKKKYKDALFLCDVEGLSYEDAGKILKCGPTTVGARLSRGRKMLYDILEKYGYKF